jgi:hypothetical protein
VALRVSIHNGGGVGWGEVINGVLGWCLMAQRSIDVSNHAFLGCQQRIPRGEVGRNEGAVLQ